MKSSLSGTEFIDRLLLDAETKFTEKIQLVTLDHVVNYSNHGELLGNLNEIRTQMLVAPWMKNDHHCQEIMSYIEKNGHLNEKARALPSRRRSSILASLLRHLLCECIALPDTTHRKLSLENIYAWFSEKVFYLLELKEAEEPPSTNTTDPSLEGNIVRPPDVGGGYVKNQKNQIDGSETSSDIEPQKTSAQNVAQHEHGRNVATDLHSTDCAMNPGVQVSDHDVSPSVGERMRGHTKHHYPAPQALFPLARERSGNSLPMQGFIGFLQRRREREARTMADHIMHEQYAAPRVRQNARSAVRASFRSPAKAEDSSQKYNVDPTWSTEHFHSSRLRPQTALGASFRRSPNQLFRSETPISSFHISLHLALGLDRKRHEFVENMWYCRRLQEMEDKMDALELEDTVSMWNMNQSRLEEEGQRRWESSNEAQIATNLAQCKVKDFCVQERYPKVFIRDTLKNGKTAPVGNLDVRTTLPLSMANSRDECITRQQFSLLAPKDRDPGSRTTEVAPLLQVSTNSETIQGWSTTVNMEYDTQATGWLNVPSKDCIPSTLLDAGVTSILDPRATSAPRRPPIARYPTASPSKKPFLSEVTLFNAHAMNAHVCMRGSALVPEDQSVIKCMQSLPRAEQGYLRNFYNQPKSKKNSGKRTKKSKSKTKK